jgi:hypothetical protein
METDTFEKWVDVKYLGGLIQTRKWRKVTEPRAVGTEPIKERGAEFSGADPIAEVIAYKASLPADERWQWQYDTEGYDEAKQAPVKAFLFTRIANPKRIVDAANRILDQVEADRALKVAFETPLGDYPPKSVL